MGRLLDVGESALQAGTSPGRWQDRRDLADPRRCPEARGRPDLERALCRRQPKAPEIAEGITGGSSRV